MTSLRRGTPRSGWPVLCPGSRAETSPTQASGDTHTYLSLQAGRAHWTGPKMSRQSTMGEGCSPSCGKQPLPHPLSWTGWPAVVAWKSLSSGAFLIWHLCSCPLACQLLLGSAWRRNALGLLFCVFNVFHACCVPLCSSSGQLPSCRVSLLSTAGGPCL